MISHWSREGVHQLCVCVCVCVCVKDKIANILDLDDQAAKFRILFSIDEIQNVMIIIEYNLL